MELTLQFLFIWRLTVALIMICKHDVMICALYEHSSKDLNIYLEYT